MKYLISPWYKEIVEYLLTLSCPPSCDKAKYRTLRLRSQKYVVANSRLYWRDPSGILLLCLTEEEVESIMAEFHEGIYGGHYSWKATSHKSSKLVSTSRKSLGMCLPGSELVRNAKDLLKYRS